MRIATFCACTGENGRQADDSGGGVVFDGPAGVGATAVIVSREAHDEVRFLLEPNGGAA